MFGAFSLDFIELGNNACLIIMIAEMPDTMMVIASISSGSMARSQHYICSMAARACPRAFRQTQGRLPQCSRAHENGAQAPSVPEGNLADLAPVLAAPATPAVDPMRARQSLSVG